MVHRAGYNRRSALSSVIQSHFDQLDSQKRTQYRTMAELERAISTSRKRRGTIQASLTKLCTQVTELRSRSEDSSTTDHAEQSLSRLKDLDSDFKRHHYSLIELIEDESLLAKEQDVLDAHDERVACLYVELKRLVSTTTDDGHRMMERKLRGV